MVQKPRLIATISGKGGVGKTTLALGTGLALVSLGYKVGLVDADIESSSLGDALDLSYESLTLREMIQPAEVHGLKVISLSMMLDTEWEDVPTLVKEDRVHMLVDQMFKAVNWGELDFLIADTPPGSGPELRALIRQGIDGLLLVTAVQRLSEMPVRRLVRMAREEYHLPIIGVVSNNPYHVDGARSSAAAIAERYGLPVLATVPWAEEITAAMDRKEALDTEVFMPIADAIEAHFAPGTGQRTRQVARLRRRGLTRAQMQDELGVSESRVGQLLVQARKAGLIV